MKMTILNKANELFLNFGFKTITMDDISKSLGISKKTLYIHFLCKNEIVQASAKDILEKTFKKISDNIKNSENPIEEFYLRKLTAMKYLNLPKKINSFYQLQKYYPKIHEKIKSIEYEKFSIQIKKNLIKGKKLGVFRKNIDIDFLTKLYLTGMSNIRDFKIFPPEDYNLNDLIENYLEYHLRAIVTRKGLEILNSNTLKKINI